MALTGHALNVSNPVSWSKINKSTSVDETVNCTWNHWSSQLPDYADKRYLLAMYKLDSNGYVFIMQVMRKQKSME